MLQSIINNDQLHKYNKIKTDNLTKNFYIYSAKIKSTHRTFVSRYLELVYILTISSICNKESFFADMP